MCLCLQLTPKCKQALQRIFKICDQDNDGVLNDREIYQFQVCSIAYLPMIKDDHDTVYGDAVKGVLVRVLAEKFQCPTSASGFRRREICC